MLGLEEAGGMCKCSVDEDGSIEPMEPVAEARESTLVLNGGG
jgi:hypothetical protein